MAKHSPLLLKNSLYWNKLVIQVYIKHNQLFLKSEVSYNFHLCLASELFLSVDKSVDLENIT